MLSPNSNIDHQDLLLNSVDGTEISENSQDLDGTASSTQPGESITLNTIMGKVPFDGNLLSPTKLRINKTNRSWLRRKYAMQQKSFVIFSSAMIALGISGALVYFYNPNNFAASMSPIMSRVAPTINSAMDEITKFFNNDSAAESVVTNMESIITNVDYRATMAIMAIALVAASLLIAGLVMYYELKHIEENSISVNRKCDTNSDILKTVFEDHQNNTIRSVTCKYTNNTNATIRLDPRVKERKSVNINSMVLNNVNRMSLVINDRPLFTALLTGFITTTIACHLWLYLDGNSIRGLYQNLLTSPSIGLVAVVAAIFISGLCTLWSGWHYYNKTACNNEMITVSKNIIGSPSKTNTESLECLLDKYDPKGESDALLYKTLTQVHKDPKAASLKIKQIIVLSEQNPHKCVYNVEPSR